MKRRWKQTAGFTLVELIVVIAILGILAGVAVPAYSGYVKKANIAADQSLLDSINTAFASACISEGENVADVLGEIKILSDGGLEQSNGAVVVVGSKKNGADITDIVKAFNVYYQGNAANKFKDDDSKDNKVFIREGMAILGVNGYYVDEAKVESWNKSEALSGVSADEWFKQVSGTTLAVGKSDSYDFIFGPEESSVKDAVKDVLGGLTYDEYMEEELKKWAEAEGRLDDYNDEWGGYDDVKIDFNSSERKKTLDTNFAVLVGAQNAAAAKEGILGVLTGETPLKTLQNGLKNKDTSANALSQSALAYGLYIAYANQAGVETDYYSFAQELVKMGDPEEDSGFKSYLENPNGTVNTDLEAVMAAIGVVNDQSSEDKKEAVTNGFSDSKLKDALAKVLGA